MNFFWSPNAKNCAYRTKIPGDKKINYTLIPIDHGMSMPDSLDILEYYFLFRREYQHTKKYRMEYCWLSWAHKDRPFSKRTLDYIKKINIMEDIEMLNSQYKFRPICLRNMRLSGTILKNGAAAGLTLGEIGRIWCRTDDEGEVPSIFEKLVEKARRQADLMHDVKEQKIYHPLSMYHNKKQAGANGKRVHPGLVSADMDMYERFKAKEQEEYGSRLDVYKVPEKRERANTMLADEPEAAASPIKPLKGDGLATVKESFSEEEKGYISNGKVVSPDLEAIREEEKCPPGGKVAAENGFAKEDEETMKPPVFSRTVSIPSKLNVILETFFLDQSENQKIYRSEKESRR